ncbi:MAG TPA: PEGA domain-containing protein [Candidatus Saccharimonadales bacterium]|nr:PEGA domain-containing protein [Candidatus Saccharimonadales bacterium]
MYRQPSKRKVLLQRIVVYSLMTVTVIGLVVVLVYVMLGYQFNADDGKIEQGGLVQFDSRPSGADISLDGNAFGTRTAAKTTMSSGQHYVVMTKDGYRQWQKSINVVPGSVLWLNYARLVPSELTPQPVVDFSSVTSSAVSPDSKFMAVIEDGGQGKLKLSDLSRDDAKTTEVTFPAGVATTPAEGKGQHFEITSWDPDSRYVLVKHTYNDDQFEWLVIDTQDVPRSKNLTTLLDVQASVVRFSNGDSQILYAQINGDVRKVNLRDATLSRPLITNVATFDLYSDNIVTYSSNVDSATNKRSVGYYIDGADAPHVVRTIDDTTSLLQFTVGRYYSETYEAIALGDTIEVLKGDLPRDPQAKLDLKAEATFQIPGGAQYLNDNTDGRFIVAQNGATYATYDLELNKKSITTLKGSSDVTRQLHWLDGYHVWSDRDGQLRMYEFDGENEQDIMPVLTNQSASLSPSGKYMYGITKSDNGTYHLTRVQMLL